MLFQWLVLHGHLYVVIPTVIIAICSGHEHALNQRNSTCNIYLLSTVSVASEQAGHVWTVRSSFSGARHSSTFDCCFCTLVDVSDHAAMHESVAIYSYREIACGVHDHVCLES